MLPWPSECCASASSRMADLDRWLPLRHPTMRFPEAVLRLPAGPRREVGARSTLLQLQHHASLRVVRAAGKEKRLLALNQVLLLEDVAMPRPRRGSHLRQAELPTNELGVIDTSWQQPLPPR